MSYRCAARKQKLLTGLRALGAVLAMAGCAAAYPNPEPTITSGAAQAAADASATLQVDATPSGIIPSPQYTARVNQHGVWTDSFVYQVQNPGFLSNGQPSGISSSSTLEHSTAWTSFSFAGSITVQVTNSSPFTSARILPSHAGIIPIVRGNSVVFTLNAPGEFAIDFCTTGATCTEANDTDLTNPMLVFTNPMEAAPVAAAAANVLAVRPGLSVPTGDAMPQASGTQATIYFAPGIYDLGLTPLTIGSNETVFLAAGAYVKGFLAFATSAENAAIRGRGILSGEDLPKAQCISTTVGCPDMVLGQGKVQSLVVEGITFIQSPFYNVSINGGYGNTVDNVKVIAWLGNSDGIQASYGAQDTGSVIENSFVKNGDDSIKLTASNLVVRNCVVWKLNNAATFEMGAGLKTDVTNILVENSDVIRGEYNWPNTSDAVFSANEGGSGNLSNYNFNDIRVENETWQLIKIEILPSNFQRDNYQPGSISGINFNNIQVTDAQEFPPVFRGYSLAHPISNVNFSDVVIGGVTTPTPPITLDGNRNASYAGNTVSDLLFRSQDNSTELEIPLFTLAVPPVASQYSLFSITQPALTSDFALQGSGDFWGDGYASALVTNTTTGEVGVWKEPYRNTAIPWSAQFGQVYKLLGGEAVAGTGDFNGDGHSDAVIWNSAAQTGKILYMKGDRVMSQQTFQPATPSSWSVAAVADFAGDGYSDVMLRDASGNLEFVFFNSSSAPTTEDFSVTMLGYSATANYIAAYGDATGHFEASWSVAGTGILQTLGPSYASIIWVNHATGQLGITRYLPFLKFPFASQVFAILPADTEIQAFGDFNGDGAKDFLLWNTSTAQNTIWYMNFDNGAFYSVGPTLEPSLPAGLQVVPN
ncbi:MAG: FG-GAP-like repeat-containing protein [Candidatus Acidiferrales bacterium]